MTLRSFVAGALALSSARAMLVVPEVGSEALNRPDIAQLHPVEAQAAQQQQVDLLCAECPFAIQSGDETSLVSPFLDPRWMVANFSVSSIHYR